MRSKNSRFLQIWLWLHVENDTRYTEQQCIEDR